MLFDSFSKRLFIPACVGACFLITACTGTQIREDRYEDGTPRSRSSFVREADNAILKHGIQMEWHPNGEKASMETYVNGYRQGYAFRWHPDGRMKSLEHFTDGVRDGQAKYWDREGNLIACLTEDAGECLRPTALGKTSPSRLASKP